ncbi:MAG TPA: 5'-nucleotidase C-terminal domain-containing protein [Saprospiraceae bacterium]|nr:5'-nucleotidase C-terminal domain-containing protein [Saprospiraceae bacterium]
MIQKILTAQVFLVSILLFFYSCSPKVSYIVSEKSENRNISNDYGSTDEAVLKMIAPYKNELDKTMNDVIGELTETMEKERPNATLSNCMCDAMVEVAKKKFPEQNIQFGLMNYGGIRINSFPKGPITVSRLYELMPFDNTLVIMRLDKQTTELLCERIIGIGGWPISKGLRIVAEGNQVKQIFINNINLEDITEDIFIALPNYVAEGGDNSYMLVNRPREDSGIYIRDILIEYVKEQKIIEPDTIKRIIINP